MLDYYIYSVHNKNYRSVEVQHCMLDLETLWIMKTEDRGSIRDEF